MVKQVTLICFVRRGGMVHYTAQLANALADKTHIELIIPDCVDPSYFDSRITLHRLPAGLSGRDTIFKLCNPRFVLNLWQLLRSINSQVVHVPVTHPWNIFIPFVITKPTLFTAHDPIHHSGEKKYIQFTNWIMKRGAQAFFIHDHNAISDFSRQIPANRTITVVPHGDYSLFTKTATDVKPGQSFLFFGRIEEYKGIGTLLEAWPLVSQAVPEWRLTIAGQGDLSSYAAQLANPTITVLNQYISDEQVSQLFSEASVVVLPYHDATQSGVLMIAAAFARPVVASNVGAIPTIVKHTHNGLLIPPRDSQQLAKAMINLAKDESKAQKLGQNLKLTVQKDSGWPESAAKHLEAYQALAET